MEGTTFAADPMRLMIAAAGIIILLALIIKCKLHPFLALTIATLAAMYFLGIPGQSWKR